MVIPCSDSLHDQLTCVTRPPWQMEIPVCIQILSRIRKRAKVPNYLADREERLETKDQTEMESVVSRNRSEKDAELSSLITIEESS
jgi:hypothetical protein